MDDSKERQIIPHHTKDTGAHQAKGAHPAKQRADSKGKLKPPFMFAGVLTAILASILFSFSLLCLKLLPEHEGFNGKMKALFFRGFFMSLLCTVAILVDQSTFIIRRDELWVNILRGVIGTTAVFGSYSALIYIGMGDATALIFSSPVWTSILSHFILGEPLYFGHLVALPVSSLGIILIAHPALIINVDYLQPLKAVESNGSAPILSNTTGHHATFHDQLIGADVALSDLDPELTGALSSETFDKRWPGIVISLATSLLVSLTFIVLKFRKSTPVQTTTFWFGVSMMLFSLLVMMFNGFGQMPSTLFEWSLLMGNGIFSWLGQSLFQWSFLYEEAGILSIVRTLDVANSFILSSLFLSDDIYWTSVVGAAIIVLVVISMMANNYIQQMACCSTQQPDEDFNNQLAKKQSTYSLSNKV